MAVTWRPTGTFGHCTRWNRERFQKAVPRRRRGHRRHPGEGGM